MYQPSTDNTTVSFVIMFDGALQIMCCLINCHQSIAKTNYFEIIELYTFSDNVSLSWFHALSKHVKCKQNSVSRPWIFQH